ncbi:acyltransferase [Ancylobacter dichloromethanicus]|nr:acyltransferase family protein [Ancylobacter dichloromethanicus]MBS7553339.1 acyltransferase [Ancylobacter dichloromethanicus]
MKYRSEIDGLRAVAVIPVILFHAGFGVFSGGYVGVDVFFVISGYLITMILLAEIEDGTFSIVRFYERRARRIVPALFVVVVACMPFAWMWMIPTQLRDFGQSVTAVVFFVSNFLFWNEAGGYFAPAAELKPLLHTWSLAVEEQYYLFAPLSLAVLWRFGRRTVFWLVVATAVLSLLATEWGWRYAPRANFFLPQFRIWEILAGSICGFLATRHAPRPNNLLSALGLAMIVLAIFAFDENTPFPSFYALLPVVGTALIVMFAHKGTYVARLLSARALVGIGLISYSAYLWHQPLFAFARIRSLAEPEPELMMALAALSVGLAYVSWRFVEQPFRRRKPALLPTRRAVFVASTAAGVLLASVGTYANVSKGIPSRLASIEKGSREEKLIASAGRPMADKGCDRSGVPEGVGALCPIYQPTNPQRRILIVGDSHSHALLPAFAGVGEHNTVYWMGAASCPPIIGVSVHGGLYELGLCEELARRELQAAKEGMFDIVVLVSRWSFYPVGLKNKVLISREGATRYPSQADAHEAFAEKLPETVRQYLELGVTVVLVDQIPEQKVLPQKVLEQAALLGLRGGLDDEAFEQAIWETSTTVENAKARLAFTRGELEKLRGDKVWVLSFDDQFERDGRYVWGDRNGAFYSDQDHLSVHGNAFLKDNVTAAFEEIARTLRRP